MPKYYTLKIELCNGEKIAFYNLDEKQRQRAENRIWITGVKVRRDRFSFELVNPFIIKSAFVVEQENFIGEVK